MKFPNEGRKILNYTNEYINNIGVEVNNFMNYCKDIYRDNISIKEGIIFLECYENLKYVKDFIKNINDKIFKVSMLVSDNERPNVLYPYEKQAIYQYFNKFDFKKHCPKKCGCIYAEKILKDGKEVVTIGLSICNDKDIFSKNIALNLAKKRAREYPTRYNIRVTPRPEKFPTNDTLHIPYKWMYESEITKFVKRCTRWFKEETIIYPNNIDFVEFPKKKKKKSNKITNEPMPF